MARAKRGKIGLFTVDPGKHTGVTSALYNLDAETVAEAMRTRQYSVSDTIVGTEIEQAKDLVSMLYDFYDDFNRFPVQVVVEDFSLGPCPHKPGKEGISPARYGWAFVGMLVNDGLLSESDVHWQLPSNAMRYNERKKLESWDAWIKGKEHERAAFAHAGARLMAIFT